MNRSAELQLRQVRRAKDTFIAPGWSPALQIRGSWSQCAILKSLKLPITTTAIESEKSA